MGASEIRPKLISSQLTARICLAWHRCARPVAFIGSLLPLPLLLEEPLFLGFHFCLSHHPPHGIRRFTSGDFNVERGYALLVHSSLHEPYRVESSWVG